MSVETVKQVRMKKALPFTGKHISCPSPQAWHEGRHRPTSVGALSTAGPEHSGLCPRPLPARWSFDETIQNLNQTPSTMDINYSLLPLHKLETPKAEGS